MKKIVSIILFVIVAHHTKCSDLRYLPSYSGTNALWQNDDTLVRRWNLHNRQKILEKMEKAMGKLPRFAGLPPMNIQVTDSIREDNYTRYKIDLLVAENERLPAFLFIPLQPAKLQKLPAMLVLHETDSLGKRSVAGYSAKPNRGYAKELAQRGYVVIAPDYPDFGDLKHYDFDNDRFQSGTMKGIFNHMRCIDFLQAREDVDPGRIGVIGHSLGGHNAMFVAAFDTRLQVVVSSCGWTQMEHYNVGDKSTAEKVGRLAPWAQKRYMPLLRDKYKLDPQKIPFNFDQVISAIAPRAFFSVSPINDDNFDITGVRKGIAIAAKTYRALNAADKLQARYPVAGHDFPIETRKEAYEFIDRVLGHTPTPGQLLSFVD